MEIRNDQEIPPRRAKEMHFPELRTLKDGECAVYALEYYRKVNSACRFITRQDGVKFVIRSFPETNECKVWKKPQENK